MFCPVCSQEKFAAIKFEDGLPVERCSQCSGVWLNMDDYRNWRNSQKDIDEATYFAEVDLDELSLESDARICPKTGRLMTKVKVSNDAPFRLDYSAAAQGVWLDKGEWDGLHKLGLHKQLDAILGERWQRELRSELSRERMAKRERERFGDVAYDELVRIREWLKNKKNSSEMIAFLNAKLD